MNFSLFADIADVMAAVGVIASLVFLATQVRRNTNEVKNTHLQSSQALMAAYQSRTQDVHLAAIVQKGKRSYLDLGEAEKLVFASWAHESILVADNFLRLGNAGILSEGLGKMGKLRMKWLFAFRGVCEWWRAKDRDPMPTGFGEEIDEIVAGR